MKSYENALAFLDKVVSELAEPAPAKSSPEKGAWPGPIADFYRAAPTTGYEGMPGDD